MKRAALLCWLFGCGAIPREELQEPSLCQQYCTQVLLYCTDGNQIFSSNTECLAACANYATTGLEGATQGDTVQCRLTYAVAASVQSLPFCMDASPSGGDACK